MDNQINGAALLLENESLHKKLHSLTKENRQLRKIQILFSQVEEMGNLGHWEWDEIAGGYITCSEQYAKIFGFTVKQMLEEITTVEDVYGLVCEEDRDRFRSVYDLSLKNKRGWRMEH